MATASLNIRSLLRTNSQNINSIIIWKKGRKNFKISSDGSDDSAVWYPNWTNILNPIALISFGILIKKKEKEQKLKSLINDKSKKIISFHLSVKRKYFQLSLD